MTNYRERIKDIHSLSKEDTLIAGGKGASLGELARAGIPVPPGFVILSTAFDLFIAGLASQINSILQAEPNPESASKKIQAMILSNELPQEIKEDTFSEFLGSET